MVIVGLSALYVLFLFVLFTCCQNRLGQDGYRRMFGFAYEELIYERNGSWVLAYPVVYALRIWAFCLSIVYMQHELVPQFLVLTLTTSLVLHFVSLRPKADPTLLKFELIGEGTVLIVADLLLTSSRVDVSPQGRELIGWGVIIIVGTMILCTQVYAMATNIKIVRLWCRKRRNARRMQLLIAARLKAATEKTKANAVAEAMADSRSSGKRRQPVSVEQKANLSVIDEKEECKSRTDSVSSVPSEVRDNIVNMQGRNNFL